jgi:hypothetical protein
MHGVFVENHPGYNPLSKDRHLGHVTGASILGMMDPRPATEVEAVGASFQQLGIVATGIAVPRHFRGSNFDTGRNSNATYSIIGRETRHAKNTNYRNECRARL